MIRTALSGAGRWGRRLDLSAANPPNHQAMLRLKHTFQFIFTVIGGVKEILVGCCYRMDDGPANVNHRLDARIFFSRLCLNVIDDALMLDVRIKTGDHKPAPRDSLKMLEPFRNVSGFMGARQEKT